MVRRWHSRAGRTATAGTELMAQVLFGTGIANMKGKVAGNYFRSNGVGTSLVTIQVPTLSPGEVAMSTTAFLTNFWSNGLTDAQRAKWISQVATKELSWAQTVFEAQNTITAMNAFVKLNYYIVSCGGPIYEEPVYNADTIKIHAGPLLYDYTVPSLLLYYDDIGHIPSTHIWITASSFVPWGNISGLADKTHILTWVPGSSPIDLVPPYTAKYGSVPTTPLQWVKVRMVGVNITTGQISASSYATSLI